MELVRAREGADAANVIEALIDTARRYTSDIHAESTQAITVADLTPSLKRIVGKGNPLPEAERILG